MIVWEPKEMFVICLLVSGVWFVSDMIWPTWGTPSQAQIKVRSEIVGNSILSSAKCIRPRRSPHWNAWERVIVPGVIILPTIRKRKNKELYLVSGYLLARNNLINKCASCAKHLTNLKCMYLSQPRINQSFCYIKKVWQILFSSY